MKMERRDFAIIVLCIVLAFLLGANRAHSDDVLTKEERSYIDGALDELDEEIERLELEDDELEIQELEREIADAEK